MPLNGRCKKKNYDKLEKSQEVTGGQPIKVDVAGIVIKKVPLKEGEIENKKGKWEINNERQN